jgi:O-antigen ligase
MLARPKFTVVLYMLLISVVLTVYVSLAGTDIGRVINAYTFDYTNKNLFTGRNEIWLEIASYLGLSISGIGYGANASDVIGGEYSSHNSFIQVYLNGGFLGLALFVFFIISTVKVNSKYNAIVFAIIFISLWEVIWFQNSPGSYIYLMILLGLKVSRDRNAA